MRITVVLPAPFSPSRACTSPGRTSKSIASFATSAPKRLVIPRSSRAGGTAASLTGVPALAGVSSRVGDDRSRRRRLVDVHPERSGLDLCLALLDHRGEVLRHAGRDVGIDL